MLQLWDLAAHVAPTDSTVLITGERGVGKERLARWLHGASPRAQRPFVPVSCGALEDTLLASELFGHVSGAFKGAVHDRLGSFLTAQGGTLFLDDIGDVSSAMQGKLLQVIEAREVMRLGETSPRRVDVRLIAATTRDLLARSLNIGFVRICITDCGRSTCTSRRCESALKSSPRARLRSARARDGTSAPADPRYTPRALDRMLAYSWPGSIRELLSAIERACTVTTGPAIDVEDRPPPCAHDTSSTASPHGAH